ncbi:MAG: pre-peptidase C-terminal domain-containing protein [Anaerolineae bacterium]|nr:pre-peptidase C-terminal domain-containing protein [Anaerolineae bacterium]
MPVRTEDLAGPQAAALTTLENTRLPRRLDLARLDLDETAELVRQALDLTEAAPRFSARLYAETEGNPFFVIEALRGLMDEGLLRRNAGGVWSTPWDEATQDYAELPLPGGVVQSIQRRLDRLPTPLAEALGLAAVLGRGVAFDLWQKVAGWPEGDLLAAGDTELWKSDGTKAGTVRVKDIQPGSGSSMPNALAAMNGMLYFNADDGTNGRELWKSGGSEAGTVLVKDINPAGDSWPVDLFAIGSTLFFGADDGSSGSELWTLVPGSGGTCTTPLPIACGSQVSGDTSGYANNHDAYQCSSWNQTGPEIIYNFTLAAGSHYTVTATLDNLFTDQDVFLLAAGGCDAGQCLADSSYGDSRAVAENVPPGTYYVAVDGCDGAAGTFTLDLVCTPSSSGASYFVYLPLATKNH